jgi:hypothetical protein
MLLAGAALASGCCPASSCLLSGFIAEQLGGAVVLPATSSSIVALQA